jgi:hypothetical protein
MEDRLEMTDWLEGEFTMPFPLYCDGAIAEKDEMSLATDMDRWLMP